MKIIHALCTGFLASIKKSIFKLYIKYKIKDGFTKHAYNAGIIVGPDEFFYDLIKVFKTLKKLDHKTLSIITESKFTFFPEDPQVGFFEDIASGIWSVPYDLNKSSQKRNDVILFSILQFSQWKKSQVFSFGLPTGKFSSTKAFVDDSVRGWIKIHQSQITQFEQPTACNSQRSDR